MLEQRINFPERFWIEHKITKIHTLIMFCHSEFDIDSYYSMNCISIPIPIATRLRMRSSIEVLFRYALICMACDFKQIYWFVVEMKVNRPLKWRRGEFFISLILIDKSKSASISKRIRTFIRIERLETCFTEDELPDQLKWTYVGVYICWACANNTRAAYFSYVYINLEHYVILFNQKLISSSNLLNW